ncbi:MAG: hypothetical protein K8R36_25340 [Planctomycetales bacterium]|nr:hypothetical protein [Planctomycetales bacterium]
MTEETSSDYDALGLWINNGSAACLLEASRMSITHTDIRRFAYLLGRRLDSPEIEEFLRIWNTSADIDRTDDFPVGEIRVYEEGFDIILAFKEECGGARVVGKPEAWACYMRFFSPEYCKGKAISPYRHPIIGDVMLPLNREEVARIFRAPSRSRRDARHVDEYDYEDCIVRFVYPKQKDHVAFVELGRHSVVEGT